MTHLVVWTGLWPPTLAGMLSENDRRARFGYALHRAMDERDLSMRALAAQVGVDPRKVAAWIKGTQLPNVFEVQELARILRVRLELFQDPPAVPPPPPPYPLERYLLEAADSGAAEGHRRATTPPPSSTRSTPPRTPGRSSRAG